MTLDDEHLIRDSWKALAPQRARASELFYQRLFEIDPSARALFVNTSMATQRDKFATTIDMLVRMLDFPPQIVEELEALARRHVGYGVVLRQYETVGDALLWALARGLGDGWTPDVAKAWTELYRFIGGVMKRAAAGH